MTANIKNRKTQAGRKRGGGAENFAQSHRFCKKKGGVLKKWIVSGIGEPCKEL